MRRSAFSEVDGFIAEVENLLSLCQNATVHRGIRTSVNEPLDSSNLTLAYLSQT